MQDNAGLEGCPSDLADCQGTVSTLKGQLQDALSVSTSAQLELDECIAEGVLLTGIAEGNATLYQSCASELASVKFDCGLSKRRL